MFDADLLFADRTYVLERLKRDEFRRVAPSLRGRVIDVGCGLGPYRRLLGAGCSYVGVDWRATPAVSVLGDVSRLPIADDVADCILLTEVLEHVPEPLAVLREVRRVLRPGGVAYVTVPMSWCLHGEPFDYYRFTPYGISYLAHRADLSVVSTRRIGGLFAFVATRFIDLLGTLLLERPLRSLSIRRGLFRAPAVVLSPLNLLSYYVTRFIDRAWDRDAICWSFVLERHPEVPQ